MKKNQYEGGGELDPLFHRMDPQGYVAQRSKRPPPANKGEEALVTLVERLGILYNDLQELPYYGPHDAGKPDETEIFVSASKVLDRELKAIRAQMLINGDTSSIIPSLKKLERKVIVLLQTQTLHASPQKHVEFKKDAETLQVEIPKVIELLTCRLQKNGEGAGTSL